MRAGLGAPMWKLTIEDDQASKTVVHLVRDDYSIGRAEDNTVRLTERNISRRHARLTKPGERWLLVTSAFHMPRSVGLFRKVGFAVEPYPVDWRIGGPEDLFTFTNIAGDGLARTDTAVREWTGLLAYRLTGRIDELLPGPARD